MSERPTHQLVLGFLFLFIAASAITALDQSPAAKNKPSFAPDKMETVLYGVAYYPEYMPYDRLDKDVELMEKAGISVVRVGESAWSTWEPRDALIEFDWMERVLDRLQAKGIKAI